MVDLKHNIRTHLSDDDFQVQLKVLKDFKGQGGSKDHAYRILEELRAEQIPDTEDHILELLDVVVGFCPAHLRVWDDEE